MGRGPAKLLESLQDSRVVSVWTGLIPPLPRGRGSDPQRSRDREGAGVSASSGFGLTFEGAVIRPQDRAVLACFT